MHFARSYKNAGIMVLGAHERSHLIFIYRSLFCPREQLIPLDTLMFAFEDRGWPRIYGRPAKRCQRRISLASRRVEEELEAMI